MLDVIYTKTDCFKYLQNIINESGKFKSHRFTEFDDYLELYNNISFEEECELFLDLSEIDRYEMASIISNINSFKQVESDRKILTYAIYGTYLPIEIRLEYILIEKNDSFELYWGCAMNAIDRMKNEKLVDPRK